MLRAYHVSDLKNGPVRGGLAAAVTVHLCEKAALSTEFMLIFYNLTRKNDNFIYKIVKCIDFRSLL